MKKTLIIAAIALISASAFAQSVSSANVVGYAKINLASGYNMIRVPFVNDTQEAVNIQDIFDTSGLTQGSSAGSADSIQLWDASGQQYVSYYLADGVSKATTGNAGKWFSSLNALATNSIAPGTGFFFVSQDGSAITNLVSGEVVVAPTGTNSIQIVEGYNLIANPFSSEWKINDGSIDWVAAGAKTGSSAGSADSIQFWNPATTSYETYYLADGVSKATTGNAGKWYSSANTLDTNLTVGISQGLFYSRQIGEGSLTVDIEQPYNLD